MDGGRAWFLARSRPIGFTVAPPPSNSKNVEPPKCAVHVPLHMQVKNLMARQKKRTVRKAKRPSDKDVLEAQRSIRQHLEYTPIGLLARIVELPSLADTLSLEQEYEHEDLQNRYNADNAHESYFLDSWMGEDTLQEDAPLADEDLASSGHQFAHKDPLRLLRPRDNCPSASRVLRDADQLDRGEDGRPVRPASAQDRTMEHSFADTPPARPKSAQAQRARPKYQHELQFHPYSSARSQPTSPTSIRRENTRPKAQRGPDIFGLSRPMSASAVHNDFMGARSPVRPMSANAIYEDGRRSQRLPLEQHSLSFSKTPEKSSRSPNSSSLTANNELLALRPRRYDNAGRVSRGRITEDLVKMLLQETNGWGASLQRGDQSSFSSATQSSWTLHRRAYTMLPRILLQRQDWRQLDLLVADPHFLVRCLAVGGLAQLLHAINAAVRALLLADPNDVPDFKELMAPSQGLDRLKQVRAFLHANREALQSQPSKLFQLAAQSEGETLWPLVRTCAMQCVEDANQGVQMAAHALAKDESQSPEYYMDLFLSLKMVLDNGCVACMAEADVKAYHSLRYRATGQLSALRKLGFRDFISLFGTKTFEIWLDLLDSAEPSNVPVYRAFVELNCRMQDVTTSDGREVLRTSAVRDAAAALGVEEDDLTVSDVALAGATLLSNMPIDIRNADGIAEDCSLVCINHRPCQWESLTVYISSTLPGSAALQALLHQRVLPSIRRLCYRRAVEVGWVDLEEGGLAELLGSPEEAMAGWCGGASGGSAVRKDIFLVLLLPSNSNNACTVERQDNLFFLSSSRIDEERVTEEAAMLLSDCLWSAVVDKYPAPTETECNFETEAEIMLRDMEDMTGSQTFFGSRAALLKSMITWMRTDHPHPATKRLHGAEGSGRSMLLAAMADRAVQEGLFHVVYFRYSRRHTTEDFVAYLCSSLSTGKERFASLERAAHLLGAVAAQQQVLLLLDGLTPQDEAHVQHILSRKPVAALKGGVRCIYTSAYPITKGHDADGAWVVPPLTVGERRELMTTFSAPIGVPVSDKAMQTLLSKGHSSRPLYLVLVARTVSLMTAMLGWHGGEVHASDKGDDEKEHTGDDEEPSEDADQLQRAELVEKLCEHLPGDLSSLLEEGPITLLERQHGQALVRRVLEYLFHSPGPLTPFQIAWMIQQHAEVSGSAVHAVCSDLWPFLGSSAGELQMEHGPMMQAVARRYFEDYAMSDREARSVLERNELAVQAAVQAAEEEAARRAEEEGDATAEEAASPDAKPMMPHRTSSLTSLKNAVRLLPTASSGPAGPHQIFQHEGRAHLAWAEAGVHPGGVLCMASFNNSDSGGLLCTGGSDGSIKIWDATMQAQGAEQRLRQVWELRGALDSDVDELVQKGERGINAYMKKFFLDPHILVVLKGHAAAVHALLAHQNLLYSGSADNTIRVWDRSTWKTLQVLRGHRNVVTSLSVSDTGLYSCSQDGRVLMWDLQSGARIGTLDGTKRAGINTVLAAGSRLFSGTERRWNEEINTIKVCSADTLKGVDELPSRAVQGLARQIAEGEEEEREALLRVKRMSHRITKLRSPIKRKELSEQIKLTKQTAATSNSHTTVLRQKVEAMKGGLCHQDDIYCLHVVARAGEDGQDLLFSGGIGAQILAWDLRRKTCIESMGDKTAVDQSMVLQYTKCIVSDAVHLYTGGGWHPPGNNNVPGPAEGCVRVWNIQTRRLVGTITLNVPVLALAIAGEALVVGDVSGAVSLFVRGERVEAVTGKMESQIQMAGQMDAILRAEYGKRRAAWQAAENLKLVRTQMQEWKDDCSLQTCFLMKLSNLMLLDGQWESPEAEVAGAKVVIKAMARYPDHPRLQIAALEGMSHLLSLSQVADHVLALKNFFFVTNVIARLPGYPSIQQAACLLLWEVAVMDQHYSARNQRPGHGHGRTRMLIRAGAIATLLAAIDAHPTELYVLNCALPLLRLLAVREPSECKAVLEAPFSRTPSSGTEFSRTPSGKEAPTAPTTKKPMLQILDELAKNMEDIRIAATQPGAPSHTKQVASSVATLVGDLTAVQGVLCLRLNGKPVQHPQARVTEESSLQSSYFYPNTDKYRRAKDEIWADMRSRAAMEWAAAMQRQQLGEPKVRQTTWALAARTLS